MIEIREPTLLDKLCDKLYQPPMTWIAFYVRTLFMGNLHFCARCGKLTECYQHETVGREWCGKYLCMNCYGDEVDIQPLKDIFEGEDYD